MSGEIAMKTIDEKSGVLIALATKIWENPEIAYREEKACSLTAETLEENGFKVERRYTGLPTAIRAVWGEGKPVIGLLGEYDALPEMSQQVATQKIPVEDGAAGHGCGHNLIGVAHLGAAIALKKEMEERQLPGTVVFYGCPAEEALTGKVFMAHGGAFKELDLSIAWHPGTRNMITTGTMTAVNSAKFHFKGVTAHAGADPQNGRSALDAAELMNIGANFLREHVTDDVRIHYSFTGAQGAPNVVPDRASVWYYVRSLTRQSVDDTYQRLIKVAKGAAMMTETEVEIEFLGGCYNTLQNKTLVNLVHETMNQIKTPEWSVEDLRFAEELDANSPLYEKLVSTGWVKAGSHLDSDVAPIVNQNMYASTDVGDVQNIAPGVFFMTSCSNVGAPAHSWNSTACSGHPIGMKGMLYGAKVMAATVLKIIENHAVLENAREEFEEVTKGKPYICPVSATVPTSGENI